MDLVQKAMKDGEKSASKNDLKRVSFLHEVSKGKSREFLGDVWLKLSYANKARSYTGKCGRVVCSTEYLDHVEKHVFGRDIPNHYSGGTGDRSYGKMIANELSKTKTVIEVDINQGIRNNDYITDEKAAVMKEVAAQLRSCGVRMDSMTMNLVKLSWFVGGNAAKIKELQKKLNQLGIRGNNGRLIEDGVYGKETAQAWLKFINKFEHGLFHSLTWIDPLQSELTGVTSSESTRKKLNTDNEAYKLYNLKDFPDEVSYTTFLKKGYKKPAFYLDRPHVENGVVLDYHMNIYGDNPKWVEKYFYNHRPITREAYFKLKDFKNISKIFRTAGRIFLVQGLVLDALELGLAIEGDLKDADHRLGKKTKSAFTGIVGRWLGSALEAQIGASIGATIGTAIFPGPGTVIGATVLGIVGGIAGARDGENLLLWVLDITNAED